MGIRQSFLAPCFLPNLFAGPYWVLAVGVDDDSSAYRWAIVIGGEPTKPYEDGCTTKQTGTNGAGLWLFSRSPVASTADMDAMLAVLKAKGVASSQLRDVAQEG